MMGHEFPQFFSKARWDIEYFRFIYTSESMVVRQRSGFLMRQNRKSSCSRLSGDPYKKA
jgi:hypothetical protein